MKLFLSTALMSITAIVLLFPPSHADVRGEEVTYNAGGTPLEGYLAWDDGAQGNRPGVLVVHEWWGHNEYARRRARMLAELGYTALAVDMYGEGKTAGHPDDAAKFAAEIRENQDMARARFTAALEELRKHPTTDPDRIAAIGYCFGGGVVLAMARAGVDLEGVVSFHGGLSAIESVPDEEVKASILVCHGAQDKFVTEEQVAAFKEEMEKAGADLTFITYEGATHSFTNPHADSLGRKYDLPIGYNEEADEKSWADMKEFLERIF